MIRSLLVAGIFLLVALPSGAQNPPPPLTRDAIVAAALSVIEQARYATLVTLDATGQPQARIVDPSAPEADLTVWVGTNARTRKAAQLAANPRVTLLYFDRARESYVALIGSARLVREPQEKAKHWRDSWAPFYKNGYRDENFLLIQVVPERLEVVSTVLGMKSDPVTWRPVILDLK